MGYPVYKLLRAVNRQYPNNGFINYVDVNEETTNGLIDEDLRDLINETLQETYIHIARDEVFSFPTVPGQREYVLPDDCDLRDIQEVTRTFRGPRRLPIMNEYLSVTFYANGGTGTMQKIDAKFGESIVLPACTLTPPAGNLFKCYIIDNEEYQPGDEYVVNHDTTVTCEWEAQTYTITFATISGETFFVDTPSPKQYSATGGKEIGTSIPVLPEPKVVSAANRFVGWKLNDTVYTNNEVSSMIVEGNTTFTAEVENVGSWYIIIKSPNENSTLNVVYKVYGESEQTATIYSGATVNLAVAKETVIGERYEYIRVYDAYSGGEILIDTIDLTEVMTEDLIIPYTNYGVTLRTDESKGNLGTVGGNVITTFTKYVTENSKIYTSYTLAELQQVYPETGYTFVGWSNNGSTIIQDEDILNTTVKSAIVYDAVFESEE